MSLSSSAGYADDGENDSAHFPLPRPPQKIIFSAKIGDGEKLLIFDTGVGRMLLDPSLQHLTRREVDGANLFDGNGEKREVRQFELPEIRIQSLTIQKPTAILTDVRSLAKYLGRDVMGVIGLSEMADRKVFLDYQNSTLDIHRGDWKLKAADVQETKLTQSISGAVFEASIEDLKCSFLIDSGDNGCLSLQPATFDQLVDAGVIKVAEVAGRAVAAFSVTRHKKGWFLKGRLMGKDLRGVSVDAGRERVGVGWLCGFQAEIDLAARELRYRVIEDAKPPIVLERMLGMIILFEEGLARVERLQPGGSGPAEQAGIKEGDRIAAFGDLERGQLTGSNIMEMVAAKAGSSIRVKLYRPNDVAPLEVKLELPKIISDWDFAGMPKTESK